MDDEAGRLGTLGILLRVPPPGSLSRRVQIIFIIYGVVFFLLMTFTSLFSTGEGSSFDAVGSFIGIMFILWGAGDAIESGRIGHIIRLSNFLLLGPILAVLTVVATYTESGFSGLAFLAAFLAALLGLVWIIRKKSAGA